MPTVMAPQNSINFSTNHNRVKKYDKNNGVKRLSFLAGVNQARSDEKNVSAVRHLKRGQNDEFIRKK